MPFDVPTPAQLRGGRRIDLTLEPATEEAHRLVAAVAHSAVPFRQAKRAIGPATMTTWCEDLGVILGGVLKVGLRNETVKVPRGAAAKMWTDKATPVRREAFWAKVDAMVAAGLLGHELGVRALNGIGAPTGQATKLWPRLSLIALAAEHGVTADTFSTHWAISKKAEAAPTVAVGDTIILRPYKALRGSYWREEAQSALPIPEAHQAAAEAMREQLGRLNGRLASATITGIVPPTFRRSFTGDLRIGGRFWSVGAGSFSSATKAARRAMGINGESIVEVDLKASQLTAFLAITDPDRLNDRDDPYVLDGVPRQVLKAFIVQTFGSGTTGRRWAENTSENVRAWRFKKRPRRGLAGLSHPGQRSRRSRR